mmetsp:Transcript_9082/g.19248  ORF Transcript_9082/g.19248 Transcript_9082/m.19248 type:complete len:224 (+) Transcript_9082:1444-2115(+)
MYTSSDGNARSPTWSRFPYSATLTYCRMSCASPPSVAYSAVCEKSSRVKLIASTNGRVFDRTTFSSNTAHRIATKHAPSVKRTPCCCCGCCFCCCCDTDTDRGDSSGEPGDLILPASPPVLLAEESDAATASAGKSAAIAFCAGFCFTLRRTMCMPNCVCTSGLSELINLNPADVASDGRLDGGDDDDDSTLTLKISCAPYVLLPPPRSSASSRVFPPRNRLS